MAITDGYYINQGGYYKAEDGSGPYAISEDGTATLVGAGGGGGGIPNPLPVTGALTDAQLRAAAVSVSGPLTNAQLIAVTGTAAQTTLTTDPAAAGQTVAALLRGILSELQSQKVILEQIATNTTTSGG